MVSQETLVRCRTNTEINNNKKKTCKEITAQGTHHIGNATVRTGIPGVEIDLQAVRPRAVAVAHTETSHTWNSAHSRQRRLDQPTSLLQS